MSRHNGIRHINQRMKSVEGGIFRNNDRIFLSNNDGRVALAEREISLPMTRKHFAVQPAGARSGIKKGRPTAEMAGQPFP
ncbi:MAG: hypothetical protein LKI94_06760 [Sporolactobacillus sp.]|nr:hypothetical protein [Sporolactobacillus sp.]